MASRWLWASLPLFLFMSTSSAVENDFSFYPSGAQPCLYSAAKSTGCHSGSIAYLNTCLCGNNKNFVINSAKCIGKDSPSDVSNAYNQMNSACNVSNTPLSVSEDDFMAAAKEGSSESSSSAPAATSSAPAAASSAPAATSTTQLNSADQAATLTTQSKSTDQAATMTMTTTTTAASLTNEAISTKTGQASAILTTTSGGVTITVYPTQTSSSSSGGGGSRLSSGATIGISVGIAMGGVLVIAILAFCLIRRRRKSIAEAHPMLPHLSNSPNQPTSPFHPSSGYSNIPSTPAPAYGYYDSDTKGSWVNSNTGHSATPGASPFMTQASPMTTLGTPNPTFPPQKSHVTGGFQTPSSYVAELPPDNNVVYEMDGASTFPARPPPANAIEMPGSTPPNEQK